MTFLSHQQGGRHRIVYALIQIILAGIILLMILGFANTAGAEDWESSWSTTTLSEGRDGLVGASTGDKIFFAGGFNTGPSSKVDIFDTTTATWSTASLSVPRYSLAAAAADGKVFFGGGFDIASYSNVVDIYDTVTGTWSTATLSKARKDLTATAVGGKVIFAGGYDGSHLDTVDIYDTATSTWSTANLSQARFQLTSTFAGDNALFAGGAVPSGESNVVDIYDSGSNSWSTHTLSVARAYFAAASSGDIALFGGGYSSFTPMSQVDLYDNISIKWGTLSLSQARYQLAAASAMGQFFFAGGGNSFGSQDTVDIYDVAADAWTTANLSSARDRLAAAASERRVFFAGGIASGTPSDTVDIYRYQIYDTITSTQSFTLDDQTTVFGRVHLGNPGSLNLGGFDLNAGSISGDAPIDTDMSTLVVGSDNSPLSTYSGDIGGGGGLVKTGTGTLRLTGNVSCDLIIEQGTVEARDGGSIMGNLNITATGQFEENWSNVYVRNMDNSGMARGSIKTSGYLNNRAGASIYIGAEQRLSVQGSGSSNSGLIEIIGTTEDRAEFDAARTFVNLTVNSMIAARNAVLHFHEGLTNQGALALSYGTSDVFGDISSTGNISVGGGAEVTFYDDVDQSGTLVVSAVGSTTSTAVFFGAFTGTGGSTGGGDIFLLGDLRPGASPAEVTFDNNLYMGPGTTTIMELGGTVAGDEYDQIVVSGELVLDGTLEVALIDEYSPEAGHSFNLVDATITGTFVTVLLPTLDEGLYWVTDELYTTGSILVMPYATTDGDIDEDGDVDNVDLQLLLSMIDSPPSVLDQVNLEVLLGNFGRTDMDANTVPEPSGLLLVVLGVTGLAICRRKE